MNRKFIVLFFLCPVLLAKAQPNEQKIKNTITTFFDGMYKADSNLINSVVDPSMTLQTIDNGTSKKPVSNLSKTDFLRTIVKPRQVKLIETILTFDIKIDGNLANAWCKYTFHVDTSFSHWGIDNFILYNDKGNWKILSVVDTRNPVKSFKPQDQLDTENRAAIQSLMNKWHQSAALGDEKIFFGSMDSSAVYLGTDKSEHWTKQEFEAWSKKYFEQDKGWDFKTKERHIYFSDDMEFAWFDELLDTWMGVSRGSGVLRKINGQYKLLHYNLAVTVPNEKMKKFVKINK